MATMTGDGPWVVRWFDTDANDNRGTWYDMGIYRWEDNAKRVVNEANAKLAEKDNHEAHRRWRAEMDHYEDSVALVAAGRRKKPLPVPPTPRQLSVADYLEQRFIDRYDYERVEFEDD
jgi:hypothetical protein